ncbi:MAG TPA: winged helix-turn-helix domain-containing protein [Pedobacter sp.]|uniref:winged helix-turn-helix domain-containing protein n=1 Tax=Pedobacter sp. TaxID=1411316 RepID=UPI002C722494|nr:winged helix-turn-helix domain-containing protein [Pedobacter sp.]HMI02003.1 winged helix-turn-helix domain-containing protein [Pedobacter sp.]
MARYIIPAFLLFIGVICAAFALPGHNDFDLAKQEILLRKIGHEILLHSGDSTSRVLPVKKISGGEYQITFANEFTFQTDTLVEIVRRSLSKDKLADNYVLSVLDCSGKDIVFGYAVFKNEKDDVGACSGRKQIKSCYRINLKFQPAGITASQKGLLLGGLPFLGVLGLLITRSVQLKKKQTLFVADNDNSGNIEAYFRLGSTLFDANRHQLEFSGQTVELTQKENALLLIFARSPNAVIERARLQKEIWEDEGVIVGRSLDMFISKLRKKLEPDVSVCLINIHGKGYKLEIHQD